MDPPIVRKPRYVRVTGSAGFIAATLAGRRARYGWSVPIVACLAGDRIVANSDFLPGPAIWLGEWTGRSGAASPREEAWACASR